MKNTVTAAKPVLAVHRIAILGRRHDDVSASIGQCDCRRCAKARERRSTDRQLGAALVALYDALDGLHRLSRSHGCRLASCGLCHDVRMSLAVLDPMLDSLEGEYAFAGDAKLTRRRDASRGCRADDRRRSPRPWRPGCGKNHPLHEMGVLMLVQAGKALDALHQSPDASDYAKEQAEVGAYLVPLLVSGIEHTIRPTPAYIRLRFPEMDRGRAQVLGILETLSLPEAAER